MLRSWPGLSLRNSKCAFGDGWIVDDIYRLKLAVGLLLMFQYVANVGNYRLNLGDDITANIGRGSM